MGEAGRRRFCFCHVVGFVLTERSTWSGFTADGGKEHAVFTADGQQEKSCFFCASCGGVLNFLRNFCFKEKQNSAFCAGKAPVSSEKNKPHRRSPGEGRGRKKSAGRAGHCGIVSGIVPQADGVRDNLNG